MENDDVEDGYDGYYDEATASYEYGQETSAAFAGEDPPDDYYDEPDDLGFAEEEPDPDPFDAPSLWKPGDGPRQVLWDHEMEQVESAALAASGLPALDERGKKFLRAALATVGYLTPPKPITKPGVCTHMWATPEGEWVHCVHDLTPTHLTHLSAKHHTWESGMEDDWSNGGYSDEPPF